MIGGVAIGGKGPLLFGGCLAQAEKRFSFRTKSLRELRRRRKIIRGGAGPQIDHDGIHLLRRKSLQVRVERLEIRTDQGAEPEITNVTIQNLTEKRSRGFGRFGSGIGEENHSASQARENSFEGRAVQLRFVERLRFDVVVLQELDRFLQVRGVH